MFNGWQTESEFSSSVLEVSSVLESSHSHELQRRRAARRRSSAASRSSDGRPDAAASQGWQRSPGAPLDSRTASQRRSPQRGSSSQLDPQGDRSPSHPRLGDAQRSTGMQKPARKPLPANSPLPLAEPALNHKTTTPSRRNSSGHTAGSPVIGNPAIGNPAIGNPAIGNSAGKPTQRSRQPRNKRDRRPVSPLLYLVRLLILGVGVGAIAGTILSVWNPAMRPTSIAATQRASSTDFGSDAGSNLQLVRSTAAALLAKGQNLSGLTPKVAPLTQGIQDLTPGMFLMDLDTGDSFSLNGESSFAAASTIKVPILVALLQDVDSGRVRLDETMVLQQ
ncbi:MAG: hypothetical protein HC772_06505, partial [Leptolyngbyaceae cyanobacterium CRU_2_3]|nr:hypothetical protein [Leptolyngbyaceae cyanobacterium CRU_2_3]